MTVRLVPIGAPDAGLVAALHRQCFDEPWRVDGVRDLLAGPGAIALFAWPAAREGGPPSPGVPAVGEPAGFGVARLAADEGEIMAIGVRAPARGRGIGRRLLDGLVARLTRRGARLAFLEVAEANAPALALYRARGFAVVGRRPGYYRGADGRRADALVMRLRLDVDPV